MVLQVEDGALVASGQGQRREGFCRRGWGRDIGGARPPQMPAVNGAWYGARSVASV